MPTRMNAGRDRKIQMQRRRIDERGGEQLAHVLRFTGAGVFVARCLCGVWFARWGVGAAIFGGY